MINGPSQLSALALIRLVIVGTVLNSLYGCLGDATREHAEPTVADMLEGTAPAKAPIESEVLATVSLDELMVQYQAALEVAHDPAMRRRIEIQLADLDMQRSEAQLSDATIGQSLFTGPINRYQQLLDDSAPSADGNDRLLYQLARAYDLDGQQDQALLALERLVGQHPASAYYAEAQFRRGELLFSQQRYAEAEDAYAAVVNHGNGSPFYRNAVYLYGWSQFKQGAYVRSLDAFRQILDAMVPADGEIDSLPRADKEMVLDTLRAVGLVFSYEQGARSIERRFAEPQQERYLHLLYESLAALYIEMERYGDAAEVYQVFVERHPDHERADDYSLLAIDAYTQGGFEQETVAAKQHFVDDFCVTSDYWARAGEDTRGRLRPRLSEFLDQLARYEHARGLATVSAGAAGAHQASLLRAAQGYEEYVATAPDDARAAEMIFLRGEALYEAADYRAAVSAYESVAYQYRDETYGAKAAYAAVLTYDRLLTTLGAGEAQPASAVATPAEAERPALDPIYDAKLASVMLFAETYPQHPQLNAVLNQSASQQLRRQNREAAIQLATRVSAGAGETDIELSALLVRGQANFELERFAEAESAYLSALRLIEPGDPRYAKVEDRLAASVYRQGEGSLASGEQRAAIEHFLRIGAVAPGSTYAAQGQYDAAAYLIDLQSWAEAEQVLDNIRVNYPDDPLAQNLTDKMSEVYQQQSKWSLAAAELSQLAQSTDDKELSRQSLYRSAQLYRSGGDLEQAIEHYQQYVERFPQPFDDAVEAREQLTELYLESGQNEKRHYWLGQLIAVHDEAGSAATERSLYLAAQAATELAEQRYQEYRQARLVQPLNASLAAKRALLEKTLEAYSKVLDYQVAIFFSQASYRMADVYAILSRDLMASQRPTSLSVLELEQYELLLEEQAYPFEDQAIAIHENNVRRVSEENYDQWVRRSFSDLAQLLPARYDKPEQLVDHASELR